MRAVSFCGQLESRTWDRELQIDMHFACFSRMALLIRGARANSVFVVSPDSFPNQYKIHLSRQFYVVRDSLSYKSTDSS